MCSIPYYSVHIAPIPSWMVICLQSWKTLSRDAVLLFHWTVEAVMGTTCWWKANPEVCCGGKLFNSGRLDQFCKDGWLAITELHTQDQFQVWKGYTKIAGAKKKYIENNKLLKLFKLTSIIPQYSSHACLHSDVPKLGSCKHTYQPFWEPLTCTHLVLEVWALQL